MIHRYYELKTDLKLFKADEARAAVARELLDPRQPSEEHFAIVGPPDKPRFLFCQIWEGRDGLIDHLVESAAKRHKCTAKRVDIAEVYPDAA